MYDAVMYIYKLADIFEKQNEKQKLNNKNYEKIGDYCFNILTSKLWSKY